jgi:hypothetical protein
LLGVRFFVMTRDLVDFVFPPPTLQLAAAAAAFASEPAFLFVLLQ